MAQERENQAYEQDAGSDNVAAEVLDIVDFEDAAEAASGDVSAQEGQITRVPVEVDPDLAAKAHSFTLRESYSALLRRVTSEYLDERGGANYEPAVMEQELMARVYKAILARNNSSKDKYDKWKAPEAMEPVMCAILLSHYHTFARIDFSDGEEQDTSSFPLHVYDKDSGLYVEVETDALGALVRELRFTASPAYVEATRACLREMAPILSRTRDDDLDPAANGIRRRSTGEILPYSPDYVFTCKAAVDYDPNATDVQLTCSDGSSWSLEEAILEWAGGDQEVCDFLWQIIAAACRPNVRWDKSLWFYATSGNNGKGTLCQLIRNLLGAGNHTSIPFADFNNNHFMLTSLPRVQAVITDENQVGKYADDNVEFKAAVTNDVFRIDRKHKPSLTARFHGLIIQCVNEVPRIRDRSDSFWRRVAVVQFNECFTGREKPEIKHDFIYRDDVLRYAYKRAIEMDFSSFTVPDCCGQVLDDFKAESSPVLQFALDVLPRATWSLLPWQLLWDMYTEWYRQAYNRSGSSFGRNTFYNEMASVVSSHPELGFSHDTPAGMSVTRGHRYTPKGLMDGPEPLLVEFNLARGNSAWASNYMGNDVSKLATPRKLKDCYRGIVRIAGGAPGSDGNGSDDDPDGGGDGGGFPKGADSGNDGFVAEADIIDMTAAAENVAESQESCNSLQESANVSVSASEVAIGVEYAEKHDEIEDDDVVGDAVDVINVPQSPLSFDLGDETSGDSGGNDSVRDADALSSGPPG